MCLYMSFIILNFLIEVKVILMILFSNYQFVKERFVYFYDFIETMNCFQILLYEYFAFHLIFFDILCNYFLFV